MESGTKRIALVLGAGIVTGIVTVVAAGLTWLASIHVVSEMWAALGRVVLVICWVAMIVLVGLLCLVRRLERDNVETFMHDLESTRDLPRNFRYPDN